MSRRRAVRILSDLRQHFHCLMPGRGLFFQQHCSRDILVSSCASLHKHEAMIFRNWYILVIISLGLAYANLSDKWDENVRPKVVVDYLQNKSKKNSSRFIQCDVNHLSRGLMFTK